MPGLIGFISYKDDSKRILGDMQDMITHHDFYVKDACFVDNGVCCTRSHINVIQKESQPFQVDDIFIWLDGELYNQSELVEQSRLAKSDPEILHDLYSNHENFSFLKNIDGIYSAVIYDKKKQQVHFITDRYGLRHLYWSKKGRNIAWASEVKAFLCLPWLTLTIDQQSVNDFFSIGYLLENRTWFNEVQLLPSGTVLSYDLQSEAIEKKRYWWWDDIKPLQGKFNETEVAEELGRLFICAVEKQCLKGERVGLPLSGGLDSRAILAAMPEYSKPIHAITFGKKGSDDIYIAAMVAKVKGAEHHVFEIDQKNWLTPRVQGIWWTDGEMNLLHMHGMGTVFRSRDLMDINLSGFLGDALLGGSYLGDKLFNLQQKYNNRGRRFIVLGPKYFSNVVQTRLPFFDNSLMDLTMSIPEYYRTNSNIYNRTLLLTFPEFFASIPWQKTGYPISAHHQKVAFMSIVKRARNKFYRVFGKYIQYKYNKNQSYTDYNLWIKAEPARSYFQEILFNKLAIYPSYIPINKVTSELQGHLNGDADYSDNLCRYLTFELWLQQAYNQQYKQWDQSIAIQS
jgi:asparagine synthase (glutamine-hydrolysing)